MSKNEKLGTFCTCGHQLGTHWEEPETRPCSVCGCCEFSERKATPGTFCTCGHSYGVHRSDLVQCGMPCAVSGCECAKFGEKPLVDNGRQASDHGNMRLVEALPGQRAVTFTEDELWVLQNALEALRDDSTRNEHLIEDLGEGQEELYESAEQALAGIYTSLAKKLS